jgi:hypothetical protein
LVDEKVDASVGRQEVGTEALIVFGYDVQGLRTD